MGIEAEILGRPRAACRQPEHSPRAPTGLAREGARRRSLVALRAPSASSAPTPLARPVAARVPLGTRRPQAYVFLMLRQPNHAVPAPSLRRSAGTEPSRLARLRRVIARPPGSLSGGEVSPPSPSPPRIRSRCSAPEIGERVTRFESLVEIGSAPCRSVGLVRTQWDSDRRARLKRPRRIAGRVAQTRTAGPVRKPAVVIVHGHRLSRLYRTKRLPQVSLSFKYSGA